ncbi:MAG TPA: hypothetical protein VK540_12805, partial [Polyangiaceae bacterium]|nr:hypothetical protein [Polyangiaceae bacterium]
GFGGMPCLDWGNNTVPARVMTTPDISIGPHTLFVVLRGDGAAVFYSLTHGATAGYLRSTTNWCSQILRGGVRSARDIAGTSFWLADGKRKQVTVSFNGLHSSHKVLINGVAPITTDAVANDLSTSPVTAPFYIGNNQVPNSPHIGVIAEVVVFNRALADGERVQVERYLAKKWALAPVRAIIAAPTQIQDCELWLDAMDSASVIRDGAGLVSQWSDKSGNAKHAVQATPANQPTYSAAGFGGFPCVDWGNGQVAARRLVTPNLTYGPFTIFIVALGIVGTTGYPYVHNNYTGVDAEYLLHGGAAAAPQFLLTRVSTLSARTVDLLHDGLRHIVTRYFGGLNANNSVRFDGLQAAVVNSTSNNPGTGLATGPMYIGNASLAVAPHKGVTAEFIVFSRMLTEGEMVLVEQYLSKKWAIAPQRLITAPTEIQGCQLWLDATDLSSITLDGSNNVSQWADKSGNAKHAVQATPANRPAYSATGFGGYPCLDWGAGSVAAMRLTTPNILLGPATVFMALRASATSRKAILLGSISHFISIDALDVEGAGWSVTVERAATAYKNFTRANWLRNNLRHSVSVAFDGNWDFKICRDGADPGEASVYQTGSPGTATQNYPVYVGNADGPWYGDTPMAGVIAEVIVFNRCLADGERILVERYLADKYALPPG